MPDRLGRSFSWLWGTSLANNLGDGILLAAAPLLIASLTDDPFPVAASVFLQRLPWLLFGILAGAVVDRVDRRRLTIVVGLLRALVVGVLALAIATDSLGIPLVYVVTFLLGTAETFADNTASTLVADTVPADGLGVANARLIGSFMVTNQLVGPPVGALLFGFGRAAPFGAYAVCMVAGCVLVSRLRMPPPDGTAKERRAVRHEIAEGMAWLWRNAPVRTLALTIAAFNITFGAAMAVFVLYARERLGAGDLGFGLLLSATAVGGIVGAGVYGRLEQRFDLGTLMRVGLMIETGTPTSLSPWCGRRRWPAW